MKSTLTCDKNAITRPQSNPTPETISAIITISFLPPVFVSIHTSDTIRPSVPRTIEALAEQHEKSNDAAPAINAANPMQSFQLLNVNRFDVL